MAITLVELDKAISTLEEAITLYHQSVPESAEGKAFRDACIQRFEYTLELSWKLSMKLFGSKTTAAKVAIREMAQNRMIDQPEKWMVFVDARNNTSHSYDENVAKKVFQAAVEFLVEVKKLKCSLEKL